MGNVAAIDIGIVVLRCTLFDRYNDLFPYSVIKKRQRQLDLARQEQSQEAFVEGSEVYS
jgi:hypothetical protein